MAVLADLRSIFVDWRAALDDFLSRPPVTARSYFAANHFLLWIHIPLFCLLAPLPWILGGRFSITGRILFPAAIPLFFLAFAFVFDRLLAYEKGPSTDSVRPFNTMLFCALPAFAGALFHVIHPALGMGMSALFGAYAVLLCLRAAVVVWELTIAQALLRAAGALTIILMPVLLLSAGFHVVMTLRVLEQILSGS